MKRSLLIFLLLSASAFAADSPHARFEFSQPHMGTTFRMVLYAPDEAAAKKAADAAFARVAQLDGIMSDYKDDSELNKLCRTAGGEPIAVSTDLFDVLRRSQDLARESGGAFDVTAGPLVRLWRRARRQRELPSAANLAAVRALVGFDKLELIAPPAGRMPALPGRARLAKPNMQLDLGGIAKGYAADKALAVLKTHGIASALVAAGGDIAVSAPPPGTNGWSIAIATLEVGRSAGSSGDPAGRPTLLLRDAAVSTSGDAEQFVEIAGARYSHIVDPRSGMALTGRSSVTVVAPNCAASDGLATAVSVLGPEAGLKLIDSKPGAAALFKVITDEGEKIYESARWKDVPKHP